MPKQVTKLTAVKVKTVQPGRYGDGDGLYLFVRPSAKAEAPETAFWLFRYKVAGRMREMGLGRARGANAVTLADARAKAGDLHRAVRAGRDPLADREAGEAEQAAEAKQAAILAVTFKEAAESYIEANRAGWRNAKHAAQWGTSLATYAYPLLGDVPVGDVQTSHVLGALEAIWQAKPETAVRLRGRIEAILDAATVKGLRSGENPARWKGHLAQILPARSKVAPVEHHAALPIGELPAFFLRLQAADGLGARALELAILTAARTGEVIGATWGEVDMASKVWTIPGARMKAGREHRVPLSDSALALLRKMRTLRASDAPGEPVFPGGRPGKGLSNMALTMAVRRLKGEEITVHGFRSTFRDWAAETTSFPSEVVEMALAHAVGDKVEAAYRRGDLFEKRRGLMDEWAAFCTQQNTGAAG
jgi:integrase